MARSKKGGAPNAWEPLQHVEPANPQVAATFREQGAMMWCNRLYTVTVRCLNAEAGMEGAVHLSIRRNDRAAVRDWRHMQRMKNELVGPEREGYEAYPAESVLVDEANQFHIWVLPAGWRLPFGFDERMVGSPENAAGIGAAQRPFDEDPEDIDATADRNEVKLRKLTGITPDASEPSTSTGG